jgi:hypothetical protein
VGNVRGYSSQGVNSAPVCPRGMDKETLHPILLCCGKVSDLNNNDHHIAWVVSVAFAVDSGSGTGLSLSVSFHQYSTLSSSVTGTIILVT